MNDDIVDVSKANFLVNLNIQGDLYKVKPIIQFITGSNDGPCSLQDFG
jgi:hypothetical protein